jgi:hypothetical protein
MKLEDTREPLHDFGKWLFERISDLAGNKDREPAYQNSGWYRAPAKGKVCLYLYFLGNSARSKHPNSLRLTTLWDEDFESLPWVEQGNNWFGKPSADFHVRPSDPKAKERAEDFVRRAFKAVVFDIASEAATTDESRLELRKTIGHIVDNDKNAPAAASRLRKLLEGTGKATAMAVRDILVNIASEVVKRALLGS